MDCIFSVNVNLRPRIKRFNDSGYVLITGLGPVGLATGALYRKMGANKIVGIDVVKGRMELARKPGLCDNVLGGRRGVQVRGQEQHPLGTS
jgi:threonine dehydrogenase-like Zn-dependent dehydrogenase